MKFYCGNCRTKLEVDDSAGGMAVECPNCEEQLVVPRKSKTPLTEAAERGGAQANDKTFTGALDGNTDHEMTISQFMSRRGIHAGMDLHGDAAAADAAGLDAAKGKKYAVGDMVAKGGMGGILKTHDLNIRRQIAMKVLLEGKNADDDDVVRFVEEAQITGQLEHPNITPVHELGVDATGNVFFTMKLIKGRSLSEILTDIRKGDSHTVKEFPLTHLINIFLKICDAVAFAHSKGVVHRDLKPENVMVGEFGEVLVIDWGIAKILDATERPKRAKGQRAGKSKKPKLALDTVDSIRQADASQRTMVGSIIGTAHFMAPEQAYGHVDDIDERSDIYALGGVLYNILTLRKPIEGDDVKKLLMMVVNGEITDPLEYNVGNKGSGRQLLKAGLVELRHCPTGRIPDALGAVAMKALSVERSARYDSVQALQSDIEKWQTGFATDAEEAGLWRQLRLMITRHKQECAMASIALLVVVAVVALSFIRVRGEMTQAQTARDRAKEALLALKGTAPSLYGLALSRVESEELGEALTTVDYAINLAPDEPQYHELRGNLLQTQGQWQEAIEAYRKASDLGGGEACKENRELCAEMQLDSSSEGMTSPMWIRLAQTLRDQGRFSEAKYIMGQMGGRGSVLANAIRSALRKNGVIVRQLVCDDKGSCSMEIEVGKKNDLEPLRGFTVTQLTIHRRGRGTSLDLSPLSAMPLTELYFSTRLVTDLGPLRGMPLERLSIRSNDVKDLTPLRGMKLKYLNLCETSVSDLTSLKGMPLESLNIHSCASLKDISPLRGLPLKKLYLGKDRGRTATPVTDFTPLSDLPLTYLDLSNNPHVTSLAPFKKCKLETVILRNCKKVTDFSLLRDKPLTALHLDDTQTKDLNLLRGMKLTALTIGNTQVGDLRPLAGMPLTVLSLQNTPVRDLRPLGGMKLTKLDVSGTKVDNLNVLKGMPLTSLQIIGAPVYDIRPLEGMSFNSFDLTNTRIRDLAPLARMTIRYFKFTPSKGLKNVDALRKTRWLRQINGSDTRAFWKSYRSK